MTNIWEFLLQTLTVSLVALLLLAVKALLRDKLPPRWQYGVWLILAARIMLPVSIGRVVLLPLPLWTETAKSLVEAGLNSAYSAPYEPISMDFARPFTAAPESVTDWLFVIYAAGIAVFLMRYLITYIRLRLKLKKSVPAQAEISERISDLGARYGLKACRTVLVPGLPSAFVCGVFSPLLALPADKETDEKVILHELLHLKYRDSLQSVFWCFMRALHWCNPFMQWVFNEIGNDMESLCDQRVLERLRGEERREYGGILLDMASEKYPRAVGTTSISNGGKNISRRIDAIVRFKKYPRGMALVSVCAAIVLAAPILVGTAGAVYAQESYDGAVGETLAATRIYRCQTVASALDTYAKGLLFNDLTYLATASPISRQEELAGYIEPNYYTWPRGELEGVDTSVGYRVVNLEKTGEGEYECYISYNRIRMEEVDSIILVPVRVIYDRGYCVLERGERLVTSGLYMRDFDYIEEETPGLKTYRAQGENGWVFARVLTVCTPKSPTNTVNYLGNVGIEKKLMLDMEFDSCMVNVDAVYTFTGSEEQRAELGFVGLAIKPLSGEDYAEFDDKIQLGDVDIGSSDGYQYTSKQVREGWDGRVYSGGGSGVGGNMDLDETIAAIPAAYAARVYWNGSPNEDFLLREVSS